MFDSTPMGFRKHTHSQCVQVFRATKKCCRKHFATLSVASILLLLIYTSTESPIAVFTTITLIKDDPLIVRMVSRWRSNILDVFHLEPIIFGVDGTGKTCKILHRNGLPCENEPFYPHVTPDGLDREHKRVVAVDAKYWVANVLVSRGYRIMFSDVDVHFFRDIIRMSAKIPRAELTALSDDRGSHDDLQAIECGLQYGAPCVSSGLWILKPTVRVRRFLKRMLQRLNQTTTWEQETFNMEINASQSMYGSRWFAVWSKSTAANFDVVFARARMHEPSGCAAVHLGYVRSAEKSRLHEAIGQMGEDHNFCSQYRGPVIAESRRLNRFQLP